MIVNITKLDLTLQKRDDGATILAMTLKNDVMKHQISPYLWNLEHISLFAAYLAGETSPTYCMAFTDLSQLITDVGPRGFTVVQLSSSIPPGTKASADIYRFILPGYELAYTIREMLESRLYKSLPITSDLDELTFSLWANRWGPRVKLKFSDYGERETLMDRYRRCVKKHPELKKHIQSLMGIAANYSDGDLVTVTIHNDSIPDSFAFGIHNALGEKIINGGIIWHEDTNRYQTHT